MNLIRIVLIAIPFPLGGRMAAQWELLAPLDTTWTNIYVKFFENGTGIVASRWYGDFQMMKTWNYGETWDTIYFGDYASDVFFVNEWIGYKCSYDQPVLKTIDGGYTWFNPNQDSAQDYFIESLFFTDEYNGYGIAIGPYLQTSDGGETWQIENSSLLSGYDIFFINSCNGYTSGTGNYFGKTSDCAENWQIIEMEYDPPNYYARGVYFIDEFNGFLLGDWNPTGQGGEPGAYILRTSDSGETWQPVVQHPLMYRYSQMKFVDENIGFAGGFGAQFDQNSILKTIDSGITWGYQELEINPSYIEGYGYPQISVTSIDCVNADTCFAVGINGAIWRTFNGGGPFYELPVGVQEQQIKSTVNVFPNPAQTTITFEGIKAPIKECVVCDNMGRVVAVENNLQSNALNVEKLKSGLHHVSLKLGEQYLQVRFVKE